MRAALAEAGVAQPVAGEDAYDDLFVVYADITADACGYTSAAVATLWMPTCDLYPSASTNGFPFGATYLAAHELAHALGAVPTCAPHEGNGGHVTDDPTDLLYAGPAQKDIRNAVLDPAVTTTSATAAPAARTLPTARSGRGDRRVGAVPAGSGATEASDASL